MNETTSTIWKSDFVLLCLSVCMGISRSETTAMNSEKDFSQVL
jgi:hypothetical protein